MLNQRKMYQSEFVFQSETDKLFSPSCLKEEIRNEKYPLFSTRCSPCGRRRGGTCWYEKLRYFT